MSRGCGEGRGTLVPLSAPACFSPLRSAGSGSSDVNSSSMTRTARGSSPTASKHSSSVNGTGSGRVASAAFSPAVGKRARGDGEKRSVLWAGSDGRGDGMAVGY